MRSSSVSNLVVGTAQLTRAYGVAPSDSGDEANQTQLVRHAADAGVGAFDTAPSYGEAERIIGMAEVSTRVITKVSPGADAVASIESSRARLRRDALDAVLIHDAVVLFDDPSSTVTALRDLVGTKIVRLGVSVYTPDELRAAIDAPWVSIVQVPVSVVNRANLALLEDVAAVADMEVLVRSVFLQGALLLPPEQLPAHLATLVPTVRQLRRIAEEAETALPQLLVSYVRDLAAVDRLVLGVENVRQLDELVELICGPALDDGVRRAIDELVVDEAVIDPRWWP